MLTRHRGLVIFLLFAVVGHASLVELWFGRAAPFWQVGFALILAPILLVLCGEWIADDAMTTRWQRFGWGTAGVGAVWHLILDAACLTLPHRGGIDWKASVAGAAVGALVMALVLRRAWRGFCDPDAPEADLGSAPANEGYVGRLGRELALLGGTAIAVFLISLGFVALAIIGMMRHPGGNGDLRGLLAGGFFALCAAIAVWMGVARRAMLLGRPSPFARLQPRFLRRAVVLATREGLTQLDRKGATVYPWETICEVWLGEVYGNAALLVSLYDGAPALRLPRPGRPAPAMDKWAKREAWNRSVQRALSDSDLAVLGVLTEEGPGVLAQQVKQALSGDSARALLPTLAEVMAGKEAGRHAG